MCLGIGRDPELMKKSQRKGSFSLYMAIEIARRYRYKEILETVSATNDTGMLLGLIVTIGPRKDINALKPSKGLRYLSVKLAIQETLVMQAGH